MCWGDFLRDTEHAISLVVTLDDVIHFFGFYTLVFFGYVAGLTIWSRLIEARHAALQRLRRLKSAATPAEAKADSGQPD